MQLQVNVPTSGLLSLPLKYCVEHPAKYKTHGYICVRLHVEWLAPCCMNGVLRLWFARSNVLAGVCWALLPQSMAEGELALATGCANYQHSSGHR